MSMLSKIVIAAGLGIATLPLAAIPSLAGDWRLYGQEDAADHGGWHARGGAVEPGWGEEDAFTQVQHRGWDRERGWERHGRWGRGRCEVVTRIIRSPYGTRRIQEERCGGGRPGWDRPGRWDRSDYNRPGWGGANPGNWGRTDGHSLTTEERAYLR